MGVKMTATEPVFESGENLDKLIDSKSKKKAALPENGETLKQLQRQQQELRLLERIRRALVANPNMSRVFPLVVDIISSAFAYSPVSLYLLEHGGLHLQAQIGYSNPRKLISIDQGIGGRVARTGQPAFIPSVAVDADYLLTSPEVSSLICVPLISRGHEVLGVLMVESPRSHPLDEQDFNLCLALAEHVVLALEQSRLYRMEQRRANQLALLNQIGRDLLNALNAETIIQRVIKLLTRKLGFYSVSLGLVEDDKLLCYFDLPDEPDAVTSVQNSLSDENLSNYCIYSGEMVLVPDVNKEPRYQPFAHLPKARSEVLVPLRSGEIVIGVLDVVSDGVNGFDDDDVILLKTLADEISVALENARRFERLQKQSEELNRTNLKLAEANRLKNEFLANVSHELRTPLNSIIGYIDMVQQGFYGELNSEMQDPIERVTRNSQRLMSLINDVLDLSNIEAGRFQVMPQHIVLSDILPGTCKNYQKQAQEKGLEFEIQFTPGMPKVIFHDPRRLHQIVGQLLSNAVKFTEHGKITVNVSPCPDNTSFCIEVTDTGIGVPEGEFEHIFEEFRQVDGSSTRQYGGTGLGLALASRTVQLMGGKITVSSIVNQGSTFSLVLPFKMSDKS